MKSERRHELQHNDLADWLVNAYESIAPYKNAILGVTILLIVAGVSAAFWRSHATAQAAEGWNAVEIPQAVVQIPAAGMTPVYQVPQYVDMMEKAGGTYAGTSAGEWAQLMSADAYLFFGEDQIISQREAGTQIIKNAGERYQKALGVATTSMARERAMFGIARATETLGDVNKAIEAYENLNKEFPKGTYKAVADQRLLRLRTPDAVEFYKALAEYTPKPKTEKSEKSKEKTEAGPKGKLDKIAPLPENPPEEPMKTKSSAALTTATTAAAVTPAEPAKPQTSTAIPKTEAPKTEPAKPQTTAPDASKTAPEKK